MQNWQKDRNYRKYENADGTFKYVITVDGEDVEVSGEVYKAYSQADRRERYCAERDAGRLLSLERFGEDGATLESLIGEYAKSAEDYAIHAMLMEQAVAAFNQLEPAERKLIQALVIDGVTERDYAARIGLSQKGVNKRKQRILEKLKKMVLKA
jgi:RNA polymerase sigma factor (sigma-70 family)